MTTTVVKRKDVFGFVRHVNLLLPTCLRSVWRDLEK